MPKRPKRHLGPLCPVMHFPVSPPECPPPGKKHSKTNACNRLEPENCSREKKKILTWKSIFLFQPLVFGSANLEEITKERGNWPLPKSFPNLRMWTLKISLKHLQTLKWRDWYMHPLLNCHLTSEIAVSPTEMTKPEPRKKNALLSIEYWLFHRDPCNSLIPI